MKKATLELTKELLYELIVEKRMSCSSIARQLNYADETVRRHAKKHGIFYDLRYLHHKFGKLTPIEFKGFDKEKHKIFLCKCECGNTVIVPSYRLITKNTKTCGCSRTTINTKHPKFSGYKEISGLTWHLIKKGANRKSKILDFNISIEYAWDLFIKQDRKCALSGLPICFSPSNSHRSRRTASLDRIDSSKGYIENNVQWVHKHLNIMKWDLSQEEFIKICKLVAERCK